MKDVPGKSEKPNRRTVRLRYYDYAQAGWYFVTICTRDKVPLLGRIDQDRIVLSDIGNTVQQMWGEIPDHYADVALDEFVIMPNHVHGIIVITPVGTRLVVSVPSEKTLENETPLSAFSQPISGSISVIVQQYKAGVKLWCNRHSFPYFQWQPRFYEHVIRNESDLNEIRNYIVNNPSQWMDDTDYVL
jgi:putative transposase